MPARFFAALTGCFDDIGVAEFSYGEVLGVNTEAFTRFLLKEAKHIATKAGILCGVFNAFIIVRLGFFQVFNFNRSFVFRWFFLEGCEFCFKGDKACRFSAIYSAKTVLYFDGFWLYAVAVCYFS